MKKIIFMSLILGLTCSLGFSQSGDKKSKPKKGKKGEVPAPLVMKNFDDSVSYALGVILAENFRSQKLDSLDLNMLHEAMKAAYNKQATALNSDQATTVLQNLNKKQNEIANRERTQMCATNKAKGAAFLAENAKRPGVTTLPNGMQYEVLKAGNGPKPSLKNQVTCHYTGWLIDGTKFDSSVDRGQPATFPLQGVIKGWQEGLQLMPTGSKYKLYIPAELGYGDNGAGEQIPGGSVLVFEVELISFE